MRSDVSFGLALFQIIAMPVVLGVFAWVMLPPAKRNAAKNAQGGDEDFHWFAQRLFVPPLAYIASGTLSLALPAWSMALLGITTFGVMWFWIFLIALYRQRLYRRMHPPADGSGPSDED